MRAIEITPGAIQTALNAISPDTPVMMINLLRYRDKADYGSRTDQTPCSGRDAYYQRYAEIALKCVVKAGGSVFWLGNVFANVVAPDGERWDDALLVQYPSFTCFPKVYDNPDYQAIAFHRTAALEDSRLIGTTTATGIG